VYLVLKGPDTDTTLLACDNFDVGDDFDPFVSTSTTATMSSLERIINDPAFHDYLAILKGARNGFVYGVKVRFPHAVVMSILFGRGE